jgi:hypothetical protein
VRGDMPQQTGALFIMMQQVQPDAHKVARQSQQAWIMSQHLGSPDVQVSVHPSSVASHCHMPMVRLQQDTIMPFIMQQQVHNEFGIIMQRFCIIPQATSSSHTQVIFIPPGHFSKRMVQRGTIM